MAAQAGLGVGVRPVPQRQRATSTVWPIGAADRLCCAVTDAGRAVLATLHVRAKLTPIVADAQSSQDSGAGRERRVHIVPL